MSHVKRLTKFGAAAARAAATLISTPVKAAEHEWKMATSWGGGPLMELGAKAFAEKIDLLSNGRIKVQVFTGGTLGKALRVSDTVKNNIAQVGHTWMGYDGVKNNAAGGVGGLACALDQKILLHVVAACGGCE